MISKPQAISSFINHVNPLIKSISLHTLHFFLYFFSRGSVSLCWGLLPSPRKNWTSVTTSSSWCRDRSSCCRRSSLRLTVSSLSSIMFQVRVCSLPATVQLFRYRDQMNSWFLKGLWEWLCIFVDGTTWWTCIMIC